jgi:hypothetical protein
MNEKQATAIADALHGETWQSGGGVWLVILHSGERVIVISDDAVCEYKDEQAFDESNSQNTILLR